MAFKKRFVEQASQLRLLDKDTTRQVIRRRQELGIDKDDEVWDGVYVVPPLANNPHQDLVGDLVAVMHEVIRVPKRGRVFPGANVSDRRSDWDCNFRAPDVVVVLNDSQAIDCTTHWFGGPDFLIEIESPGDETEQKIPFYSRIKVRELLIIHRDSRRLRLYRHDGQRLALVSPSEFEGGKWLASAVVPLAFRRKSLRTGARTEIRRTDGKAGRCRGNAASAKTAAAFRRRQRGCGSRNPGAYKALFGMELR